jgi:probable O-glycosylation ligase (exosortase A-associated)
MTGAMVFCAASALGSQSRGGLLAIAAMAVTFWWRGKGKLKIGIMLLAAMVPLVAFMPDSWTARMSSINDYQEDSSAQGRINAWWTAWNIAMRNPTGIGFNPANPEVFATYAPNPLTINAAHSIYFQTLGNHGFIGLLLFLGIWFACWWTAGWLRTRNDLPPEAKWAKELGAMCQVSLVGYAVGGAFLSLAYFDLPYEILVMLVLTRVWVEKKAWQTEPTYLPGWRTIPGLARQPKAG